MHSFSGPADIYDNLVEKIPESDEWLFGLVAFAVVEEQKIEWMKHHAANNCEKPSDEETEHWYRRQPEGVLLRAKDTARTRLTNYAEDAIASYMAEFEKEIAEGVIVGEIRDLKKFWPQLGINIVGGMASSLLFAALLTIVAFLVLNDSSPVTIGARMGIHTEENAHAKE